MVPKKSLYTKSYGKLRADVYLLPKHRTILYELDGYIATDHVDPFIDDLLDAAKTHAPVGMIADPRNMKVLNADFQRAIQTRFWPAIAKLGVKRNPAIMPGATVTQTSVKRMVSGIGETITVGPGQTLQIAVLESLDDCLEWIGST
ncbi:hypothetical protein [Sandaracinus amylolyticus]|uniref:Uncharacterized protein n=1 Tax=Sandaracinus amylolyticus TaxID=927083 RepID=A0A0F6YEY3_9BACT|nr:hypothetical protein [Sandaracinus amylolyticus]AKF02922.1 hypothetical protein DB32_000070 [Sandaracinus amylolyticus]